MVILISYIMLQYFLCYNACDDTAGVAYGIDLSVLFTHVNSEIKKIARLFRANNMVINVTKTKFIANTVCRPVTTTNLMNAIPI
jgi:hypothetical protein